MRFPTLLLVLCIGSEAWAQASYDASLGTLPQAQGWTYSGDNGNISPTVSGGVLYENTSLGGQYWSIPDLSLDFSKQVVLEAKLFIVSSNEVPNVGTGTREGYYFDLNDRIHAQDYSIGLAETSFNINSIDIPNDPLTPYPFPVNDTFHIFRFVIANSLGTLLIDGHVVASGITPVTAGVPLGRVLFGAEAGASISTTELQYLRLGPSLPTFTITPLTVPADGATASAGSTAADSFPVPVQTIFATPSKQTPIALVQGKATAFFVGVKVDDIANLPLSNGTGLEVQVTFDGNLLLSAFVNGNCTSSTDLNCWRSDGSATAVINPSAPRFTPSSVGTKIVSATINPQNSNHIAEALDPPDYTPGNGHVTNDFPLNVQPGHGFSLFYVGIKECGSLNCGQLSGSMYQQTVDQASLFIQATYPVSEAGVKATIRQSLISGASATGWLGVALDLAQVRVLASINHSLHAVGVVPTGYFAAHGIVGSDGFTPGFDVSLVEADQWTGVAHEVGHQFGLSGYNGTPPQNRLEEYGTNPPYIGNPASGFSVSNPAASGSGSLIQNSICFMGAGINTSNTLTTRWIDSGHYLKLLSTIPQILP